MFSSAQLLPAAEPSHSVVAERAAGKDALTSYDPLRNEPRVQAIERALKVSELISTPVESEAPTSVTLC